MKTAVLVLGYRARGWLERGSLEAIRQAATRLSSQTRIVYLDNYSRDGSVQWLAEYATDVDVLLSRVNAMYCTGVNTLIQYAAHRYRPEYYVLADADNTAEPDCYRRLVDFLDKAPEFGIAQPLVRAFADPQVIYSRGHRFTRDNWCLPIDEPPLADVAFTEPVSCSISSTAVRAEVFRRCGLLDPVFDMYYESADLSRRAAAAGFRLACVLDAVAYNDGTEAVGVDSMHHRYYFNRNRLIYWRLHDEETFVTVAAEARARLDELQARLAAAPYGLDAHDESIRAGLASGLAVSAALDPQGRPIPGLGDYDKTSAVLLQSAAGTG
jgi:GT2 family glycosyltransferase